MKTAVIWGFWFGGAHLLFIGWFAVGSLFGHGQNALIALSMTIDIPVMFFLEILRSLSLISETFYSAKPIVLYMVFMVIGSMFYFVVGALFGWIFSTILKKNLRKG